MIVLKDYENMKPVYADCYKPSWNKHFTSRMLWKFLCRTTNAQAAKEFEYNIIITVSSVVSLFAFLFSDF